MARYLFFKGISQVISRRWCFVLTFPCRSIVWGDIEKSVYLYNWPMY